MNKIHTFKTPSGDEMVVLSRQDYDRLVNSAEDAADIAEADAIMARVRAGTEKTYPLELAQRLAGDESPVKVWREYRGLSQADLAKKVDSSTIYISQIETGRRKGSVALLHKIAAALDVDLNDIA